MTWLLILAIIGLTLVLGVVFLELLIRWVSLARVQTAAKEASLVYARDMVRLRDNCLSQSNSKDLSFQSAGIPQSCDATGGGSICGCTALKGQAASIPGANTMEFLNASQTLLYNVWGKRIADPKEVDDVRTFQCYKPYSEQRFSKIQSTEPTCTVTGKVTSPITDLNWELKANPYGTGLCCSTGSPSDNAKDFCVDVKVTGRMDPIMAGGLPFLSAKGIFDPAASAANERSPMKAVEFITVGGFEIHARAVVNKMSSKESTGDDSLTQNLSGETIQLEDIPKGATCGAAPQVVPVTPTPITPGTPPALSLPPLPPLPPSEIDPNAPPIDPGLDPTPPVVPNCPYGFSLGNIINRSSLAIDYVCNPCPAAGSVQSQGGQICSGNSVVRTDTMNDGNCGTYPQAVTVANCGNGCSNGACSPPPPPNENRNFQTKQESGFSFSLKDRVSDPVSYGSLPTCIQSILTACDSGAASWNSGETPCILDRLFGSNTEGGGGARFNQVYYFDSNCRPDRENYAASQTSVTVSMLDPISLVLSDDVADPYKIHLASFALNSNHKKLYEWKASESHPLLVFDPHQTGFVKDGSQLLGNYSFGKKWKDGYQALATLDLNHDGQISGRELKDLALWFDKNQDAISQKGELKRLSEVGITKLFYKTDKKDSLTHDIHASKGFERLVNGKLVYGASLDWFGQGGFKSVAEANSKMMCKQNEPFIGESLVKCSEVKRGSV